MKDFKDKISTNNLAIILSALIVTVAVFSVSENVSQNEKVTVLTGNQSVDISVEIADTESKRRQGLMYRRQLGLGEGMLFVFEEESPRSFWMKNTYIPLDIVFLDSEGNVLNVEEAFPQPNVSDEELERYRSSGDAKYVLELNSTFSEKYGLNTGDQVKLYQSPK